MPEPLDEQTILTDFARRRTREQIATLIFTVSLIASLVGISAAAQSEVLAELLICAVPIIFVGLITGMIAFTASNWRCPACSQYLASPSNRISPFFTPDALRCPNCRAKLR